MLKRLRKLTVIFVLALLLAVSGHVALAATSDDVTVTATPAYVAITNAPTSQGYGVVTESSDNDTAAAYFTITNSSTVTTNISIWGTAFTGGVGWTLSTDGSVGADTVGMYAGTVSGSFDVVVEASPGNTLKSSLASSTNQTWHLRLATGTFSDGVEKESTVTVSAAAA